MSVSSGGGGPSDPSQQNTMNNLTPGQDSGTSAWAGAGGLGGKPLNSRTFLEIIEEEKKNRNILDIQLERNNIENPRYLTFDDIGELIFDVIKIEPKDCLSCNNNTGRSDTKHIKLKPGVNISQFSTSSPIIFKEHSVTVRKQLSNVTRVTFKNVPLNVPLRRSSISASHMETL